MLVVISKETSKCFALLWRKPADCLEEDMLVFTLVEMFAVTLLCWAKIWRGFSSCSAEYLSTGTWWTGSPCVLTMGLSSQLGESGSGYLVLTGSLVWATSPVKDKNVTLWGMLNVSKAVVDPFSWLRGAFCSRFWILVTKYIVKECGLCQNRNGDSDRKVLIKSFSLKTGNGRDITRAK